MKYKLRNPITAKQWHAGDELINGMREDYTRGIVSWLLIQHDGVTVARVNDGDWVIDFGDGTLRAVPDASFGKLFAET